MTMRLTQMLGLIGILTLSITFMGTGGCDKAVDEADAELNQIVQDDSTETQDTEGLDIDEDLKKLIAEGKATLQRAENGDYVLVKENGETVILEGQKEPAEVTDETPLGEGSAVQNAPASVVNQ